MKSGRRKPVKARRQPAPARPRARPASDAVTKKRLAQLRRERDEALEQQAATAEVLKVISSSPGDLKLVFEAVLERAVELCEAGFGVMFRFDGDLSYAVATRNLPPAVEEFFRHRGGLRPTPGSDLDRLWQSKQVVHTIDMAAAPAPSRMARIAGVRTQIAVPLLKDDELVGAMTIFRQEVRPFSDRQIELLTSFAAQAVIAVENTRLLSELRQRTDDLAESLEQQAATAEVLKVISGSLDDAQPVFDAIVQSGQKLFPRAAISVALPVGDTVAAVAIAEQDAARAKAWRRRFPFPLTRDYMHAVAILDRKLVDIPDVRHAPADLAVGARNFLESGYRALTVMPMMRGDVAIGVLSVVRLAPGPLSDKQRALLKTFADQAVIAIENARLLGELRQRTDELTESLEQQTAISEILQVISNSPSDVKPVFDSVAERAAQICEAQIVDIVIADGDTMHVAATFGNLGRPIGEAVPLDRSTVMGRSICDRKSVHVVDQLNAGAEYPRGRQFALQYGHRTILGVPLLREGRALGTILVRRTEVRPFEDKHIALLRTFADQAAIAIENTRLLNELRQRTDDLSESLEQQTATSEVLRVISSSQGELEPVFQAMLENAIRICEAKLGILWLVEGDGLRCAALHGASPEYVEERHREPLFRPGPKIPLARALRLKRIEHVPDIRTEQSYVERDPPFVALADLAGARTLLVVPLLKDETAAGAIAIYRQEVRPFTDKQIGLMSSFAAQAVIAIENARLLGELHERTDDLSESLLQQTATADVLKVISRSTFDLKTVLDTLLRSAADLCDADQGTVAQRKDDQFYRTVAYGFSEEFLEYVKDRPVVAARNTGTGRALVEGKVVHIPDVHNDPEFDWPEALQLGGFRTMLGVPMLREGVPVGVLTLTRSDVRPFSEKQIELVATFADQAAIAIENVRLFDEIQDKSRQLEEASKHKSQFLANMSHELRTPLNAILGYTELILDNVYGETPAKMRATLERIERNGRHLLGLINDVLDLSKIEAGQLSLAIGDYSLKQVVHDVYGAVESLAANKHIGLKVELPHELPGGRGDERRLTQVLLNLVGNAIKFTDAGEVVISASASNGSFKVAVRDTGPGISHSDQAKIFEEFQQADNSTTKQKGGTGLGLAIARRIMEMHGGRLWVESEVGAGSTFTFTLPVRVEQQARQA